MAFLRTASGIEAHGGNIRYTRTTGGGHQVSHHHHHTPHLHRPIGNLHGGTVINNIYQQPLMPNYGMQMAPVMPMIPPVAINPFAMAQPNMYSMATPNGIIAAGSPPVDPNSTFGSLSNTFGKVANVAGLGAVSTGAIGGALSLLGIKL
jgi:hypothetical protein